MKNNWKLNIPDMSHLIKNATPRLLFTQTAPPPVKYKNTVLKEMADDIKTPLDIQLEAIESIAQSAQLQAHKALEELSISKEQLQLNKEQVESLSSIAQDAKTQASTACKELEILKQQLAFAKSEAESAKKDAVFAKITSILAIIISIVIPILTQ